MNAQSGKNYTFSYKRRLIKWIVFFCGIGLMIVSLMASMQSDSHFVPKRIWLVDTSLSMKTKDISSENGNISRIEAAKKLILSDIFEGKQGLITFARTATLQLPLTSNAVLFENTIANIHTFKGAGGSDISQAIQQTQDIYGNTKNIHIILVTDGESFDVGENFDTSSRVQWSVIGIGSGAGGPIVESYQSDGTPYYKMYQGEKVISRLDSKFLAKLSDTLLTRSLHLDSTRSIPSIIQSLPLLHFRQSIPWLLLGGILLITISFFVLPYRYISYD